MGDGRKSSEAKRWRQMQGLQTPLSNGRDAVGCTDPACPSHPCTPVSPALLSPFAVPNSLGLPGVGLPLATSAERGISQLENEPGWPGAARPRSCSRSVCTSATRRVLHSHLDEIGPPSHRVPRSTMFTSTCFRPQRYGLAWTEA